MSIESEGEAKIQNVLRSGVPKRTKLFSAMLDSARPGAEFKLIEDREYFLNTLMRDKEFVESLERALERGVKATILVNPENNQKDIFDFYCGSYSYGGIKNLARYIMLSHTRNNEPSTKRRLMSLQESLREMSWAKANIY